MATSRSKIVKDLDAAFSRYIRLRAVNLDGFVECYTCGRSYEWKKIQCGHFMSRARYATRWHEDNCRPQCYGCNVMQQGRQYDFGLNLDIEREGLAEEMHQLSLTTVKFATWELEEMLKEYKTEGQILRILNFLNFLSDIFLPKCFGYSKVI
jgi:hypothetical protein